MSDGIGLPIRPESVVEPESESVSKPDDISGPDPEPEETPWEKRKRLYEENRSK